jgi:hypothetical protein
MSRLRATQVARTSGQQCVQHVQALFQLCFVQSQLLRSSSLHQSQLQLIVPQEISLTDLPAHSPWRRDCCSCCCCLSGGAAATPHMFNRGLLAALTLARIVRIGCRRALLAKRRLHERCQLRLCLGMCLTRGRTVCLQTQICTRPCKCTACPGMGSGSVA